MVCHAQNDGKTLVQGNKKIKYRVSDCSQKQVRNILLKNSGLSGKDINETFANANIDESNRNLFEFLQNDWHKEWIYLHGTNGTGKSFTANCIANMLIDKGIQPIVVRELDMASSLQATFTDTTGENAGKLMYRWKNAPVLIIQDLGKYGARPNSEWWGQHIFDIIDYRMIRDLPIVITSNFRIIIREVAIARFGENHGAAISSRLKGKCLAIPMMGRDQRVGKG